MHRHSQALRETAAYPYDRPASRSRVSSERGPHERLRSEAAAQEVAGHALHRSRGEHEEGSVVTWHLLASYTFALRAAKTGRLAGFLLLSRCSHTW